MRRAAFLVIGTLPLLRVMPARAQSDADPASWSRKPALRVLLGPGEATPASNDLFDFNGRSYRGTFQRLDDGQIVNLVDLEEYLCSVVAREMPARWPSGALEAQSICARTYVLQRSDPRRPYDLIPSELDQVYEGVASETPGATDAVSATAGQVLHFGGRFARIAYSSCCGGHTEALADAWGGTPVTYLNGVVCTWCSASPNYRWTRVISANGPFGAMQDLRITERDPSGRARAFAIVTDRDNTVIAATALRRTLGTRVLPSLLVSKIERDAAAQSFMIAGGGLGHGVGLCQWGARGMAQEGCAAPEIVGFYFPGTVVDNLNR
jgi:stage II sporulation protein D